MTAPRPPATGTEAVVRGVLAGAIVLAWAGWLIAGLARSWPEAAYWGVTLLLLFRTREWLLDP